MITTIISTQKLPLKSATKYDEDERSANNLNKNITKIRIY